VLRTRGKLDLRGSATKIRLRAVKYDRMVLAYHGCDASTASQVLSGQPFRKSQNVYD
jgi:hypothetical protein